MTSYKATTLENLKRKGSQIEVRVEAMLFSGKSDGNGVYVCSLAKDGELVPAKMSNHLYDKMESTPGIYKVIGEWTEGQLEVHNVDMAASITPEKREPIREKRMYDDEVPHSYVNYLKKKEFKPQ